MLMEPLPAIAAAATTTATLTATATAAAKSTAAPAAMLGFRASFVYVERTAIQILTIEPVDRIIGLCIVRHFDERKTPGLTGVTVPDDVDGVDTSVRLERRTKGVFGGPKAEITDKDIFH